MSRRQYEVINFFAALPDKLEEESFSELCRCSGFRVERICSRGQASPPGFWYDQDHAEWVMLLQGAAGLQFDGEEELTLSQGDCILIPAHARHRVSWTTPEETTVWLAVQEFSRGEIT
ncbi:MAG: cupin domain-containing protein [Syntrophaceae bacterium]|nr:cupin domain-containing protein [Syntrophaceae bacterium]